MSQPHENLIAWRRAHDFCVRIYAATAERFPPSERFGLTAQLRRAAYSVPANIVEGYADSSSGWRLRYLRIAVGSLAEVGYALHLAASLGYLTSEEHRALQAAAAGVAAPLHGLIRVLRADRAHREAR